MREEGGSLAAAAVASYAISPRPVGPAAVAPPPPTAAAPPPAHHGDGGGGAGATPATPPATVVGGAPPAAAAATRGGPPCAAPGRSRAPTPVGRGRVARGGTPPAARVGGQQRRPTVTPQPAAAVSAAHVHRDGGHVHHCHGGRQRCKPTHPRRKRESPPGGASAPCTSARGIGRGRGVSGQMASLPPSALTEIPNDSPTKQPLGQRANDLRLRWASLGPQRSPTQPLTEAGFVGVWYPSLS